VIYSAATEHYGSDGNLYYGDQPGSWPAISDLERVDGQGPAALAHTLNDLNAWQWPSATDKQRPATEFWFYVFYQPNEETLLINYTDSETGEVLKTYDVPTSVDSVVATELYSPPTHYYVTNFSPIVRITNNGLAAQVVNIPVTQNSQTITRRYTDAAGHALLPTETHTGAPFTTLNLAGDTYLQDYPNSPYHLNIAASTISFTSNAFVGLVAQPAESFSYDHLSDFLSFADDGTASFPGITDQVTANTIDIPFGPDGITIPLSLFSPEHVASATPTAQDQAALRLEIASATNDYQALLTKWLTSDEAGLTAADQAFVAAKTTAFTNNAAQLDWSDSDAITLFLWDAYNWLFAMNTYNNITVNYVYEVDPIGDPTADPQTRTQSDLDLTVTPKDYYDNTKPGQVDAGVLVKTKVQVPDAVSVTPADYYNNTQAGQVADGVLVKTKVQVPDAVSVTPADYYDNTQPGQVADGVLVKAKVQVPDAISVTPADYYDNTQSSQVDDGILVKTKVQVPDAISVIPADYYDTAQSGQVDDGVLVKTKVQVPDAVSVTSANYYNTAQAGQIADGVLVKTKVQVPDAVSVTPADYYNTTKTQAPDTDTNHHEASSTTPTTGQTTTPRNSTPAPATAASTRQPATVVPATTAPTATVTPAHTAAQPTATPAATTQATTLPQTGAADDTALLALGGLTILGSIGLLGAAQMRKRRDGTYWL
jgi:LPXTG-motif cell wall-anchored protein